MFGPIANLLQYVVSFGGAATQDGAKKAAWSVGKKYGWARSECPTNLKVHNHSISNHSISRRSIGGGTDSKKPIDYQNFSPKEEYEQSAQKQTKEALPLSSAPLAQEEEKEEEQSPLAAFRWWGSN